MALIQLSNIKKTFVDKKIFENVHLQVNKESKIGFVGNNGTGKTSLFKIIMEELEVDEGQVTKSNSLKINYMSQIPTFDDQATVLEEALKSYRHLQEIEKEISEMEKKMGEVEAEELEKIMEQHGTLQEEFTQKGGYRYQSRTEAVLMGLGFTQDQFSLPAEKLSGGQKNRLGLARTLLTESDLVLLDEPTNFLDLESIEWLENELIENPRPFIVISHDRYFLNKVALEIWELAHERITSYKGNYNQYEKAKEEKQELLQKAYEQQQAEIKRQEDFIARNIVGQKHKQAQSRRRMLEKLERIEGPQKSATTMDLSFDLAAKTGKVVLKIENLSHAYGDKLLFQNLHLQLEAQEKLAVIGPNGCGKSTLLHIITEQTSPSQGKIQIGHNVEIGFYHQELASLKPQLTVFEHIKEIIPTVNDGPIRDYLAGFLFRGDDVFQPVAQLSGGEKSRVALARLIIERPNFLILDEPTNHLDIASCHALEKALQNYEGTILFVSHDRYFINKVANRLLIYHEQEWINFPGNYDLFAQSKSSILPEKDKAKKEEKKKKQVYYSRPRRKKKKHTLEELETKIIEGETQLEELMSQMSSPEVCKNPEKMKNLKEEYERLSQNLQEWNEEWESWE